MRACFIWYKLPRELLYMPYCAQVWNWHFSSLLLFGFCLLVCLFCILLSLFIPNPSDGTLLNVHMMMSCPVWTSPHTYAAVNNVREREKEKWHCVNADEFSAFVVCVRAGGLQIKAGSCLNPPGILNRCDFQHASIINHFYRQQNPSVFVSRGLKDVLPSTCSHTSPF